MSNHTSQIVFIIEWTYDSERMPSIRAGFFEGVNLPGLALPNIILSHSQNYRFSNDLVTPVKYPENSIFRGILLDGFSNGLLRLT